MYVWISWVINPKSGENVMSTAPLEIYLLRKMVTCSVLILPAVLSCLQYRNVSQHIVSQPLYRITRFLPIPELILSAIFNFRLSTVLNVLVSFYHSQPYPI